MQTCDPLRARQWFKLREPVNWAISIAAFAVLFFILQFFSFWVAFGIALAAASCLHFFYLENRTIRIKCPYGRCQEIIETNTPFWTSCLPMSRALVPRKPVLTRIAINSAALNAAGPCATSRSRGRSPAGWSLRRLLLVLMVLPYVVFTFPLTVEGCGLFGTKFGDMVKCHHRKRCP